MSQPQSASRAPLPGRYEVRQLTSADAHAMNALLAHANMYYSPVFDRYRLTVPVADWYDRFERCGKAIAAILDQGWSFGVSDRLYKRDPAAAHYHGEPIVFPRTSMTRPGSWRPCSSRWSR